MIQVNKISVYSRWVDYSTSSTDWESLKEKIEIGYNNFSLHRKLSGKREISKNTYLFRHALFIVDEATPDIKYFELTNFSDLEKWASEIFESRKGIQVVSWD